MSKKQLRIQIEELRAQLDNQIKTHEDLSKCQELSEQLDTLIETYMEL